MEWVRANMDYHIICHNVHHVLLRRNNLLLSRSSPRLPLQTLTFKPPINNPTRAGRNWDGKYILFQDDRSPDDWVCKYCGACVGNDSPVAYATFLRSQLMGTNFEDLQDNTSEQRPYSPVQKNPNLYFSPKHKQKRKDPSSPYSLSPVSAKSQKFLETHKKVPATKIPCLQILDAPLLQDDFCLNLVDWSSQNVLSVGLASCVYLWSSNFSQGKNLCDLTAEDDFVTSVSWSEKGSHVAVGTQDGLVQIWDVASSNRISNLNGHTARVGALAWNGDVITSGCKDGVIYQRDVRTPSIIPGRKLTGHQQEVCGLKWSPDSKNLASGGKDNKLFVWNSHSTKPIQTYTEHNAAVKAIAWSPHHHGLLASGGGGADRYIRFWDTLKRLPVSCIDTKSQVSNIAWSKYSDELVSTHGFNQKNKIIAWQYPSLRQSATLTGHTWRVLYLAISPDGETIVTGAADETLRFWNAFSKVTSPTQKESKSALNLYASLR